MRKYYTLLIILLCSIHVSNAQVWSITEMAPMPMPISNNSVVEAFPNGQAFVYSFGGIDSTKLFSGITNKSFKYNVLTDTWDTIPSLPDPMTKIAAAASYVNGKIYIIGGYTVFANGNEITSNKTHIYDPVADTFMTNGANIPVAIDDHVQAVYKDSLIYVVSGWSNTTNVRNVQIYDTYLDSWTQATQVPFNEYRIFGATGSILGDTIYYFGGTSRLGNFPATNILRKGAIDPTDPTQITWSFSRPNLSVFSYRSASSIHNNKLVWFGGSSTSYNFDGIAYNGTGGVSPSNWTINYDPAIDSLQTFAPSSGLIPMDLRGVASISDSVKFIVGGMENNQLVSNKTLRLSVSTITGINEVKAKEVSILFPNPADDFAFIESTNSRLNKVAIYDVKGKLIYLKRPINNRIKVDVDGWANGLYFVSVETESGQSSHKLAVFH